jgi:hypothetical protein
VRASTYVRACVRLRACVRACARTCVCVCVCVCARAREFLIKCLHAQGKAECVCAVAHLTEYGMLLMRSRLMCVLCTKIEATRGAPCMLKARARIPLIHARTRARTHTLTRIHAHTHAAS